VDESTATTETESATEQNTDSEIADLQAKLADANKRKAEARAAERKATGKSVPPSREGKHNGEVLEGHRWDSESGTWIEYVGVDLTQDPPYGFDVLGDGSEGKPNRVEPVRDWHTNRA